MRSAVVVGAGVGGLAIAGGLARTGWQVTLLERADRVRPGRAAVLLWPNGVRALKALGLGAGLDAIVTAVPATGLHRPDGRWLRRPEQSPDGGSGPVVVHREDLHDVFVAGLSEGVEIVTGITVRTARPVADRPAVGDGRTTWDADLVVAADGAASAVRQRLSPGAVLVSGGCATWRAVIPWYRAPELPAGTPSAGELLGVGHRFVYAGLGERGSSGGSSRGGIYWSAIAPGAARPEPAQTQLTLLRRWFAAWHSPVAGLLAATEPDDLVQEAVGELRPLPESFAFPVGQGGYVLLGEAAHAMVDQAGHGPGLALEDAATLQVMMRETVPSRGVAEQLMAYSRLRRSRVARFAGQSRRLGQVLQARGKLAVRARDVALGRLAPRLFDATAASAAQWSPPDR